MREVHGVVAKVYGLPLELQQVRISDTTEGISLVYTLSSAAILNSEEARFLAKQLVLAAQRLDARSKK